MYVRKLGVAAVAAVLSVGMAAASVAGDRSADRVARGRYLVTVSGCNDCHTSGYLQTDGKVPEQEWLKGAAVGYQGPWGTTYAANLRLTMSRLTEDEWLVYARQQRMPPMPWFNLRAMTDADLAAVYAYVRSLGEPGVPAPAYVAPGGRVTTPYFVFVPQVDDRQAAAR